MIIEDFVIGEGDELTAGATAKIHYTGYLTDGTVFDSSVKRGRPPHGFEVGAGRVIKGWDEGVVGMRRGGKRRLIIPPALGYQQRRAGRIPPNSTLVFTLDLTGFMPPLPEPQPQSVYAGTPVAQEKRPDGLEIYDYRVGDGAVAKAGDTVHVHYRGTLTKDGTEFDASAARRKPITFELGKGRVIKGWDQGIEGMKVGGLRKLVIPAALGYGERARGKIPANADLTFTVELMAVEPAAAPATPAAPTPNPPTPGTPVQ
ncbi:MAG: FKBP-type peptidyl-prolyl cis-trans isomerase [Myxococcales bacterium]|nr:FKBP-type peptidyl-prolyl cis-trans isomerase [Myxococcales bacterium]